MKLPKILVQGKFQPGDLIVSVSESAREIDPFVESKLDDVWEKKVTHARKTGKLCYNGLSYRLNSFAEKNGKVFLDFGVIDFKTRDGLIAIPEYFNLSEEYYRKGCFVCASIKTTNDMYLMVELSGKSMNPNSTDQIGGVMETNIPMNAGDDIFTALYKECEEEAGITHEDIQECYLKTIYLTDKHNIAFYFEIILNISSDVLAERFMNNKDADIKSILFCSPSGYIETLKNHSSLNKQFTVGLLQI